MLKKLNVFEHFAESKSFIFANSVSLPLILIKISRVIWAPNGTRLSARCHFTGPKKLSNSRAQPPPNSPRNGYALVMSNQRFLKIVCFCFPTYVPKKIEYIRF